MVIKDETIWCTQKAMAQLFGVGVPAISKHLKNIFEEEELMADSVISKMETTATDDKTYETSYYSLDVPSFLWDSASSPATPNSCILSLFMQTPGSRGLTGVVTEITGEEGGVTEIVVPGKLLQRLAGTG